MTVAVVTDAPDAFQTNEGDMMRAAGATIVSPAVPFSLFFWAARPSAAPLYKGAAAPSYHSPAGS